MSDYYPPGVSGNEPQITGDWPCIACGGSGGSKEDGNCWMCNGTGIHPEEAPRCPECNSPDTDWFADCDGALQALVTAQVRQVGRHDEYNVVVCHMCGEVSP